MKAPISAEHDLGKELTKADYEALAAFRLALRRFVAFSDTAIRDKGITPQQHQALLAIKASPDERLTVGALADALLLQPHSGAELASRLEAAALVARKPAADDRRKVLLELTPEAEVLLAGLASIHLRELAGIRPLLLQALQGLDKREP